MTAVVAEFTVIGTKFANLNGSHGNPHGHQALMDAWQQIAILSARGCPHVDAPVVITALVHRTTRAASDAHNVTPTIKACIDAAVKARIIEDDNDGIVKRIVIERGDVVRDESGKARPAITVRIEAA